jgi:hypothetical protein
VPKFHDYVFVLWGDKFEEAIATIFVTELREAGLRVKVVGLTPQRISGLHGLALVPDLTLDQALPLASQAMCLVIPNAASGLKRLKNDPRLREFFAIARANRAKFIIGSSGQADLADLGLGPIAEESLVVYPEHEGLVEFARELGGSLSATN